MGIGFPHDRLIADCGLRIEEGRRAVISFRLNEPPAPYGFVGALGFLAIRNPQSAIPNPSPQSLPNPVSLV